MCIIPSDSGLGGVDTLPARQVVPCPALVCPTFFREDPAQSYVVSSIVFFIPRRQLELGRTLAHVQRESCWGSDRNYCVEDSGWKTMTNLQGSLHHSFSDQLGTVSPRKLQSSQPMISHSPPAQKRCGIVTSFCLSIIKNLLDTTHHHCPLFKKKFFRDSANIKFRSLQL